MEHEPVEELASLIHDIWANWMKYLFSKGHYDSVHSYQLNAFVIPEDVWVRWARQMSTPYYKLSEEEKDSDRGIAIDILNMLRRLKEEDPSKETHATNTQVKFVARFPDGGEFPLSDLIQTFINMSASWPEKTGEGDPND